MPEPIDHARESLLAAIKAMRDGADEAERQLGWDKYGTTPMEIVVYTHNRLASAYRTAESKIDDAALCVERAYLMRLAEKDAPDA